MRPYVCVEDQAIGADCYFLNHDCVHSVMDSTQEVCLKEGQVMDLWRQVG